MYLLCTIGSQGLSDGRCIQRGETYEVDDITASTLVAAGYATEVVKPRDVTNDTARVPNPAVVEVSANETVTTPAPEVDIATVAENAITAAESADAAPPAKKKRVYKRRT